MKKSPAKRVVYVAEDKRLYDYVTVVQINLQSPNFLSFKLSNTHHQKQHN
jgi:hypothetical protein